MSSVAIQTERQTKTAVLQHIGQTVVIDPVTGLMHTVDQLPVAASGEVSDEKLVRADDGRLSDARTPVAHGHGAAEIVATDALQFISATERAAWAATANALAATKLGLVGDVAADAVTNTAAAWSALPVGYSRLMSSAIGVAGGLPTSSVGYYFHKLANRESSGGWSGVAVAWSTGDAYLGIAVTSSNLPTWTKIHTAAQYPNLAAIEALAGTSGIPRKTAANTWSLDTTTYAATESGSCTLSLSASVTAPTGVVYDAQYGYYVRNGKVCTVVFLVRLTSLGTGGSGNVILSGWPFAPRNSGQSIIWHGPVGIARGFVSASDSPAHCIGFRDTALNAYIGRNANGFSIVQWSEVASGIGFYGTVTYITA